jgi:hypothetical protein
VEQRILGNTTPTWSHFTLLPRQLSQLYDGRERRIPENLLAWTAEDGAAEAGAGVDAGLEAAAACVGPGVAIS